MIIIGDFLLDCLFFMCKSKKKLFYAIDDISIGLCIFLYWDRMLKQEMM